MLDDEPDTQTALALGYFATACFTLQYMPQAYLNYKRKSVRGFSTTGIIIKHVGAAFLLCNTYLIHEPVPVIMYGLFNVLQHSMFMLQFTVYESDTRFLKWLLFPLVPLTMGQMLPSTIYYTNFMKPLAQVASHFPQLYVCYNTRTTAGCSKMTQHLNVLGGMAGLYMCYIIPPYTMTTYLIYINSCFQAISLYFLAFIYDGYPFQATPMNNKPILPNKIPKKPKLGLVGVGNDDGEERRGEHSK